METPLWAATLWWAMKSISQEEFIALLKIEDKWLDVCEEERTKWIGEGDKKTEKGYVAHIFYKNAGHFSRAIQVGELRKTKRGAINNLFTKYYGHYK